MLLYDSAGGTARGWGFWSEFPAEKYVDALLPEGASFTQYEILTIGEQNFIFVVWFDQVDSEGAPINESQFIVDEFGQILSWDEINDLNRKGLGIADNDYYCEPELTLCVHTDVVQALSQLAGASENITTVLSLNHPSDGYGEEAWGYTSGVDENLNVTINGKPSTIEILLKTQEENRAIEKSNRRKMVDYAFKDVELLDFIWTGANKENAMEAQKSRRLAFELELNRWQIEQLQISDLNGRLTLQ